MHKKVLLIIGTIFLSLGLIAGIIAGGFWIRRQRIVSNAVPVTATIVDITSSRDADGYNVRRVYVEYDTGGRLFNTRLNWSSTSMRVGQGVDLLVDRDDPTRFISAGFMGWFPVFLPSIFFVTFGGVGAILLFIQWRINARSRWLYDFGTPVWANVLGIDDNWNITVNGRPAQVIIATYGNMQFRSGPLDNNDLMNVGQHVKVLIDPNNANRYAFDLHNESYLMPHEDPQEIPQNMAPNTN